MNEKRLWQWLIVYRNCKDPFNSMYTSACGLVYADTEEQAIKFATDNATEGIKELKGQNAEDWEINPPLIIEVKENTIEIVLALEIPR